MHAPLYPFMRERHWFDTSLGAKDTEGVPHPFLHRNVSDFDAVAYRSRFTGSEFYLADHHVQGAMILPGVVGLEMARAAFAHAAGDRWARCVSPMWCGRGRLQLAKRLSMSRSG